MATIIDLIWTKIKNAHFSDATENVSETDFLVRTSGKVEIVGVNDSGSIHATGSEAQVILSNEERDFIESQRYLLIPIE